MNMDNSITADHLEQQRQWSSETFGPGQRLQGVLEHIRQELVEVEAAPEDVSEWADIIILALDGAFRSGHLPQEVIDAILAKNERNRGRQWPDWKNYSPDEPITHIKE